MTTTAQEIVQLIIGFVLASCSIGISLIAFFGALKMNNKSNETQTKIQVGIGKLEHLVNVLSDKLWDHTNRQTDAILTLAKGATDKAEKVVQEKGFSEGDSAIFKEGVALTTAHYTNILSAPGVAAGAYNIPYSGFTIDGVVQESGVSEEKDTPMKPKKNDAK